METFVQSLLRKSASLHILVIGDLMIDQYLWGKIERISPEAPVPIVDIEKRERRLGGAANAAINLRSLGANCTLCGLVGDDPQGVILKKLAGEAGIQTDFVFPISGRKTTEKSRIICSGQQVLRMDEELRTPISAADEQMILEKIKHQIPHFDGIIFSDYDKGFLSASFIQAIISYAKAAEIPTMADPKFKNFWQYEGCTLFKPNLKELNEGLGIKLQKEDFSGIQAAMKVLRERMPHSYSLITLSEQGMLLSPSKGEIVHFGAHRREIVDVSGAGDAVVAVAGLCLAAGFSVEKAAEIANVAGGLVCEEIGVAPIRPERLLKAAALLR